MATRREKLEAEVVASDKASKVLGDVAAKAEGLDGTTAEVGVTADDDASAPLNEIDELVKGLDGETAEITLRAQARNAQTDLDNIVRAIGKVKDKDKLDILLEAKGQAEQKISDIDAALDKIPASVDTAVDVDTSTATTELGNLRTQAQGLDRDLNGDPNDQSGSVFANFAGNAASELPGVSGAFGPLNMAIGQFVEYGSEGNIQLKELAKFAGGIALLGGAFAAVTAGLEEVNEDAKRSEERIEALGEAMDGVTVTASDMLEVLRADQDALMIREDVTLSWDDYKNVLGEMLPILGGFEDIDVGAVFDKAGISLSHFSRSVTGGRYEVEQLELAISNAKFDGLIDEDEANAALRAIEQAYDDVIDAEQEAATEARAFAVDLEDANTQLTDIVNQGQGLSAFGSEWSQLVADVADGNITWEGAADAINRMSEATGMTAPEILAEAYAQAGEDASAYSDRLSAVQDATESIAEATREEYLSALEDTNDQIQENIDLLDEQIDAFKSSADAYYASLEAIDDLTEAEDNYNAAVEEHGRTSEEAQDALVDHRDAVISLVDATQRQAEEEARANGVTRTRTQVIDAENAAYLNQAATVEGPLQRSLLAYVLRLNGIPEERITEIFTDTDPDDLAQTTRELDGPTNKRRTAAITADANEASLAVVNNQLNVVAKPRTAPINADLKNGRTVEDALNWLARPRTSPILGSTTKRAQGDPFTAGGQYLLGEQGPELVTLPMGSQIDTAAQTRSAQGGGNTYNQWVTVNQPAGVTSRDTAAALRRQARIQGPAVA